MGWLTGCLTDDCTVCHLIMGAHNVHHPINCHVMQRYLWKEGCNCVKAINFMMLAKSILYCFFSALSDICNQFLLGTVDNQKALGIIDKSLEHNFYYTLIYPVFVFNLVTMILRLNCYLLTSLSPDLNVLILW
jgi:hypothetical protein